MSEDEGTPAPPKRSLKLSPQTILVLGNTLLVCVALGVMLYTKLIYERPAIVEETEIKKVEEDVKKSGPVADHILVPFEQMLINLAMTGSKAHYATITFALECRDEETASIVKYKKSQFTDKLIAALGRRQMAELNTIQGKLLLKTELMHEFNKLAPSGGILDLYFSDFVLQ